MMSPPPADAQPLRRGLVATHQVLAREHGDGAVGRGEGVLADGVAHAIGLAQRVGELGHAHGLAHGHIVVHEIGEEPAQRVEIGRGVEHQQAAAAEGGDDLGRGPVGRQAHARGAGRCQPQARVDPLAQVGGIVVALELVGEHVDDVAEGAERHGARGCLVEVARRALEGIATAPSARRRSDCGDEPAKVMAEPRRCRHQPRHGGRALDGGGREARREALE
jgi:hypothetical protein